MKPIRNLLSGLFIISGFIITLNLLHAQDTATSGQDGTITDTNIDWNSLSDAQVELKAVESVSPIPYADLSETDLAGTFWSAQHSPLSLEPWPPLPTDLRQSPVWSLGTDGQGNGIFLLDDLAVNYNVIPAGSGVQALDEGGGFTPDFNISSNGLWLQITGISNGFVNLILYGTTNGVEYQILSEPALTNLPPVPAWNSEGMFWGSESTNWTAMSIPQNGRTNLFFDALSWQDSTGTGIPNWWWLLYYNQDTNVDAYADPMGDGWNNLQKFQLGFNPTTFDTPPAPQGVTVNYNVTNNTITVSWLPNPGPVTGYTVNMNGTDYTVSADSFSYENDASDDNLFSYLPYGNPTIYANFQVQANYADGDSAWSALVPLESNADSPTAYLLPGPQRAAYMAVTAIPPGTTAMQITRVDQNAENIQGDSSFNTNFDIPISDFTNGLYVWPASLSAMVPIDSYGYNYYIWYVQAVNGNDGPSAPARLTTGYSDNNEFYYNDYQIQTGVWPAKPYFDGREQLKQNLIFLLQAGLDGQPFQFTEVDVNNDLSTFSYPTNYAYAGFYQSSQTEGDYSGFDLFLPFGENYLYENFVFNLSGVDVNGLLNSFTNNYVYNDSGLVINQSPTYQFEPPVISGTSISPVLPADQTRWLFSYPAWSWNQFRAEPNMSPIGITGSFTTNGLASDAQNTFGLQFLSTEFAWGNSGSDTLILYPGNYTTENPGSSGWFYSETTQPQFQTVEYDFWNPVLNSLPGTPSFSTTNVSGLLIASVGSPDFQAVGYAKLAVTNGYSGVYGYLGQYFDHAYEIDTNGIVTTNIAGILSPYGDFFPTNPGPAALITMPDPDTGEQGTCTVYNVKLQLDVNHDGIMDTSFGGPDNTSSSQPYVFWLNNNYDRTNYDADDNTNYEDDLDPPQVGQLPAYQKVPDCDYVDASGDRVIPTKRDLEDYARLWVCGITSNLFAALPSGSTVTLNWGDVGSPNSANPTIDLFLAADPDGGIGYLTNETIATEQTNIAQCPYIGRLGPGQSLQLDASQFSGGTAHFIWCGVSNGSGGLNLTIADASGNVLGQTTAYIQLQDIKQMYERWTVGDDPNVAPTNTPMPAANDLPTNVMQVPFEYTPPTSTNTPYILFVHGWNLTAYDKDRFAETAFKRLYWQGYQGRFGEFRWPTYFGFTSDTWDALTDPRNFDNSEYQAWQSGAGLLNLLDALNAEYPGHVYMLAHSLGNVVAGEALRLAGNNQVVNTYVASQGAISAHIYDSTVTSPYLLQFSYQYPTGPLSLLGTLNYGPSTPDIYGDRLAGNYGGGARQVISFYNINDYALAMPAWGFDQITKPDTILNVGSYYYNGSTNDSAPWNHFEFLEGAEGTIIFDIVGNLNNLYTVMSYAAESRSTALGATPDVLNVTRNIDLTRTTNSIWPSPDPFGNSYKAHFWHSSEFEGDNAMMQGYWRELLGNEAFQLK